MIVDLPPPLYSRALTPPPNTSRLLALPDHILLQILTKLPLPTLSLALRLTNKKLFLLSSHILRNSFLPAYTTKVKMRNHTTDTAGLEITAVDARSGEGATMRPGREVEVLDLFISACINEAVKALESELFLLPSASTSAERDIFDLLQPKARVEDLIIAYGVQDGIIRSDWRENEMGDSAQVVAGDLAVPLSASTAKLMLPFPSSSSRKGAVVMKSVLEVRRRPDETLEKTAESVLDQLARIALVREGGRKGWYFRG